MIMPVYIPNSNYGMSNMNFNVFLGLGTSFLILCYLSLFFWVFILTFDRKTEQLEFWGVRIGIIFLFLALIFMIIGAVVGSIF